MSTCMISNGPHCFICSQTNTAGVCEGVVRVYSTSTPHVSLPRSCRPTLLCVALSDMLGLADLVWQLRLLCVWVWVWVCFRALDGWVLPHHVHVHM